MEKCLGGRPDAGTGVIVGRLDVVHRETNMPALGSPICLQALEPFGLGVYAPDDATAAALVDPALLNTAALAYEDALQALRARARSALRLNERHALAKRILDFAMFGERDQRQLKERALASFP
jgi:hypothetical protein